MLSNKNSIKVSRILHAGYILECGNTKIAFDTIFENPFSQNCHAYPSVKFDYQAIQNLQLDALFISHHHDDHCSLKSLNYLNKGTPIYLFCIYDELFEWIKELGFTKVYSLKLDQLVSVGDFQITPRRALDEDVDSIFEITACNLKILNVVDSWIAPNTLAALSQSSPWDLVMWPFQTMRELEVLSPGSGIAAPSDLPAEWLDQIKILNPRFVIASSCQFLLEDWSWYNQVFFPISYKKFKAEVEEKIPTTCVIRLDPSQSLTLSKTDMTYTESLSWIDSPDAAKEKDYHFNPFCHPPTTAEVAKHFPALTPVQKNQVLHYCQEQILTTHKQLEPPNDVYFDQKRIWKLSLYDHKGDAIDFYYCIHKDQISQLTSSASADIAWTTELPIAKLYGAIAHGETLTSLYMRINGGCFAEHIEQQIRSADILEDPLIRCLFNGIFGSYQKAQLKMIKISSDGLTTDN